MRYRLKIPVARPALIAAALTASIPSMAPAQASGARMNLGAGGESYLRVGGHARVRAESWSNFAFGATGAADADDTFVLGRLFAHAHLVVQGTLGLFLEGKSSLLTERSLPGGNRATDEDQLDVQQAWAELSLPVGNGSAMVRVGRQDVAFGRERLVSPLDWVNTRRTFQGVSGELRDGRGSVRFIVVRPVEVRPDRANRADSSQSLFGVLASRSRPGARSSVETYYLAHERRDARFNGTTGLERRHTFGARAFSRAATRGGFDADVEAAFQFGNVGGERITAWLLGSQFGFSRPGRGSSPRVYAGLDYGSGDGAAGGRVGTASQLFPLGHAYLGYADVHGRQNVVDASIGATGTVGGGVGLQVDLHNFWRASSKDGLYGVDGRLSRAPGTGLSNKVGTNLDVTLRRRFHQRFQTMVGWSRYVPGPFLKGSGLNQTMDFVYASLQVTF